MTQSQENQVMEPQEEEILVEYGKDRQAGTAGPDATYIVRSVERWRLRGEGYMK